MSTTVWTPYSSRVDIAWFPDTEMPRLVLPTGPGWLWCSWPSLGKSDGHLDGKAAETLVCIATTAHHGPWWPIMDHHSARLMLNYVYYIYYVYIYVYLFFIHRVQLWDAVPSSFECKRRESHVSMRRRFSASFPVQVAAGPLASVPATPPVPVLQARLAGPCLVLLPVFGHFYTYSTSSEKKNLVTHIIDHNSDVILGLSRGNLGKFVCKHKSTSQKLHHVIRHLLHKRSRPPMALSLSLSLSMISLWNWGLSMFIWINCRI